MSASPTPAFILGEWLGLGLLVFGPAIGGFLIARRMNADRSFDDRVKWPIVAGSGLSLLFLLGQCANMGQQMELAQAAPWVEVEESELVEAWPTAAEIDERATVRHYSDLLTSAVLKDIEAEGKAIRAEDITTTGRVITRDQTPMVYIAIDAGPIVDLTYVIGPVGNRQAIVGCGQPGGNLNLRTSGCAAKVRQLFGIELAGARKDG